MAKSEAKEPKVDLLVLGEHPAAYLAAALLRHKTKLRVVHGGIPGESLVDRLVMINPEFFDLHPLLEPLARKIDMKGVYGLRFLADEPPTASEFRSKSAVAYVAQLKDVREALAELAAKEGVEFARAKQVQVHRVDERGVEVSLNGSPMHPTAIVLAGRLDPAQHKILSVPEEWERGVLHRYTFVRCKGNKAPELGPRPLVPMSLDLKGQLFWAWLLPGEKHTQLAVEQPTDTVQQYKPYDLLRYWAQVLARHGVIKGMEIADDQIESVDLPFAGALAHEGLANRTLLVGPAGGFYTACAEDVYSNCWSAIYAADVLKKALKEPHLQDALQVYRQKWRTTLGDYLRGPQQNLRFLLPLVYRNQVMTNRMAEAVLTGKSVVR